MSGSLADLMRTIDAQIFAEIGEIAIVGSTEIPGIFTKRHREVPLQDGSFVGLDISFDCQISPAIAALVEDDELHIVARDALGAERDLGTYKFRRRLPKGADESGLVILELAA
jgi:hypothetical protein